jgi:hypothetical protein
MGFSCGCRVGDETVGGTAHLAGDFTMVGMKFLQEHGNSGEIVTGEAAPDAGGE